MKRATFIQSYVSLNRRYEAKFYPEIKRALDTRVKGVRSRLRSGGVSAAISYINSDLSNPAVTAAVKKLYRIVGTKHAQINYTRLKSDRTVKKSGMPILELKGFGFNSRWVQFIQQYLQAHLLDKITFKINASLRATLLTALNAMVNQGLSVDAMVDKLENWPGTEYQAARIVRTEVNRAANTGAKAQAATDEFQQLKEWIAVHDNRTRGNPMTGQKDHANHWALDRVTIDEEDSFVDPRNGDLLDHPGDPKASAASTINCRCSVAYTYKRDANGNLIPKRKSTTVIYPNQFIRRPQTIAI